MNTNKISFFVFIALLLINCSITNGQEILLTIEEIQNKEHKTLAALKKLEKKPRKKPRQERFINAFNESVSENEFAYASSSSDNDWEKMINALNSLELINLRAKFSKAASNLIKINSYSTQIDSVKALAIDKLYNGGKKIIDENSNNFAFKNAYELFYRLNQIHPNYKDVESLIDLTLLNGTKNVYFEPVTSDNMGNQIQFGTTANDYIRDYLINDLSNNLVGSKLDKSSGIGADYIVSIRWKSINVSPERNNNEKYDRTIEVKENGVKKKVSAQVIYNIFYKDYSATLNSTLKDIADNSIIIDKDFQGFFTDERIKVSYSGDKRALTNEDLNHINNAHQFVDYSGSKAVKSLYGSKIHNQLLYELGYLLNWNYRFIKP